MLHKLYFLFLLTGTRELGQEIAIMKKKRDNAASEKCIVQYRLQKDRTLDRRSFMSSDPD